MRPRLIGLTGNIGAGKSTVARALVERGAALVDADVLARAATADPEVLEAIRTAIPDAVMVDGKLDRASLAARVFADDEARRALNAIVHPWVRRASAARVAELAAMSPAPPVILLDIPLLYENGLEVGLDGVIVVDAPLEQRVARVVARSGLTAEAVRARDASQMPAQEKVARADFVLRNDGSVRDLRGQLDALWDRVTALQADAESLPH